MTKQLQVWKFIHQNLQQDIPVMLLYVVESVGSSPGRQGFFMAVNARHIMKGSIGGGIMEHKFVEMAKDLLLHATPTASETLLKRQVHDKAAAKDQSGMICSGEQTILVYQVQSSDLAAIEKITDCLRADQQGLLQIVPGKISFTAQPATQRYRFEKTSDEEWLYQENIGIQEQVHIIGGGHCAAALSRLMRMMDFLVIVYEDRPLLNTMLQNEAAHKKIMVGDYNELTTMIDDDENAFVVIMTFGYRTDDIALRALIDKKFRYLGVLGSRKKIEKMFAAYREEGWSQQKLDSIYAPIGLPIKSETPEEIAVSIAAEIIKIKHQHVDQDR